jgi:cytochrome c oxidase cbb3-type subunit 3
MNNKQLKYCSLLLVLILGSIPLIAQEAASDAIQSKGGIEEWVLNNLVLLMGAVTALGALWSVIYLNSKILEVQKIQLLKEHGMEAMQEVKLLDKDPWWKRWYDKSWDLVPMEKEKDILLDHNYDGIKELDNVLPPWWVAMFWGCVFYGFAYLGYYHVLDYGQTQAEEYESEVKYAEAQVKAFLAKQADQVDENNVTVITDDNKLSLGEASYMTNCAVCHGQAGEGGIGPNLTDKYWLHGGHINDIFKTIKYGVPAKGMVAWKAQLRDGDIQNLSSYILTLKGTNPANAKDPQGEIYEEKSEN